MKRQSLTIIICIIIGLNNLYSQKIKNPEPEKVTISDFSADGDKSVCLWYRSIYSFPYFYSYRTSGALDYLFSVKNETYMRILLNRNDTSFKFFAIHKYYHSIPELITVTCYYLNNKKITSGKFKGTVSVLIINYFDKGCFLDLSSLKDNARNLIVDIKFTYPIFSKKEINFYLDKKLDYKFMYVRMDVPEIYKYNINFDDRSITEEISKPHPGPILGYAPPPGVWAKNFHFMSKYIWEKFFNSPNIAPDGTVLPRPFGSPIPFYCMLNSYIFKSKGSFVSESDDPDDNFPAIIKLGLNKIDEIWR